MKKVTIFAFAALAVVQLFGEATKPKLSPEQIAERKYRHFGGYVYQKQKTKIVCISNEQQTISLEALQKIADEMQTLLMLPVQINATRDVGVTLKVCESDHPAPLMVMPDNAAAYINIKALKVDNPSPELLEERASKELWRGLIYTLGGGNTYVGQCVMKQVTSLRALDAIPTRTACPEAFTRVKESAAKIGIKPARKATYRQACKEGWAPAPENDVQKAIWNEIQAIPKNPIKIEFDPKKGR